MNLTKLFMMYDKLDGNGFFKMLLSRKTVFVIAAVIMLFICTPVNAETNAGTTIIITIGSREVRVNDTILTMDSSYPLAQIINDRTYIPLRYVGVLLDAEVTWNGDKREVTVTKDDITTSMVIGVYTLTVNGSTKLPTDAAPVIIDDRTMVPVAILARALNCEVTWDHIRREATIINLAEKDGNTDSSGAGGVTEAGNNQQANTNPGGGTGPGNNPPANPNPSNTPPVNMDSSGGTEQDNNPPPEQNSTIDLDKYRLSASKVETAGSISANDNKLVVSEINILRLGKASLLKVWKRFQQARMEQKISLGLWQRYWI